MGSRWGTADGEEQEGTWLRGTGVASGNEERKKRLFGNRLRKRGEKDSRKPAGAGTSGVTPACITGLVCVCVSCVYQDPFHCTKQGLYKLLFVTPSLRTCWSPVTSFIPTYCLMPSLLRKLLMCFCIKRGYFSLYLFSLPSFPNPSPPKKTSTKLQE